jgi:serine/threonine protein kinase
MPSSTPFPQVGKRYRITESLGRGGMGVVYKAFDDVTKRDVAIKTLWGDMDAGALELFEREWTVLARLSHPNIVDILDTGELEDNGERRPFFVMPLLPGNTLDFLMKNESKRLTVERVVEIMCQACKGLQAAHDKKLVHRDLKPSNIFVMDDDTAKIIDFGVAHLAESNSITGTKGTLQYMSPEQIDLSSQISARSDIFSLAVVCYEALTRKKPFAGLTEGDTIDAIRTRIPPPASEINDSVNQLISRTLHKAMAKQPFYRFSSAKDFAETLRRALRNEPIERFDQAKIQPRIERVRKAFNEGDHQFAMEILTELEWEGHIDPQMPVLRQQIEQAVRERNIRQLLENTRTRMQSDEHPLALQKLGEVLALDPGNAEALALRSQIEEQQDLRQYREEKRRLYEGARSSYQNGELSAALSKLERGLDLSRPSSAKNLTSDLDAQYQSFYDQVRAEREATKSAYIEARKSLEDKQPARALEICGEYLKKRPGDPMFQGLRLEAEEMQRQQQSEAAAAAKARLMEQIDGHFAAGEYRSAHDVIKQALGEFPHDKELEGLASLAEQGIRRSTEANLLLAQGAKHCQAKNYSAGLDALRKAERLDPRNTAATSTLLSFLVEHARELINTDWRAAEPLIREASALNAEDAVVRSLNSLLDSKKRQDNIHGILAEARSLQAADDIEGALSKVEGGLVEFPSEIRLAQLRSELRAAAAEVPPSMPPPPVAAPPAPPKPAPLPAAKPTPIQPAPQPQAAPPPPAPAAGPKKPMWLVAAGAGALVILGAIIYSLVRHKTPPPPPPPSATSVKVSLSANEPGAIFKVDGAQVAASLALKPGEHNGEADLDGYLPDIHSFTVSSGSSAPLNVVFTLRPALPELRFSSGIAKGSLILDDAPPADLQEGAFTKSDLAVGDHKVRILDGSREVFAFGFTASPRAMMKLTAPLTGRDNAGVVISSLGGAARVYATPGLKGGLSGQSLQNIPPDGLAVEPANPPARISVSDEKGQVRELTPDSSALPVLTVLLSGGVDRVPLTVTANVPDAAVSINGKALGRKMENGSRLIALGTGTFNVAVTADGYQPAAPQTLVIKAGDSPKHLDFQLTAIPHLAALELSGAPPEAAVFLDEMRVGTVNANGIFNKDVNPGTHVLEVRKAGLEDYKESHEFKAGENVRLAVQMHTATAALALHVSPANAKITMRRDADIYTPANGQTAQVPPGSYIVTAAADSFKSRTETVQAEAGKPITIDWALLPAVAETKLSSEIPFANAKTWTLQNGWMTHSGPGVSVYLERQGTHVVDIYKKKGAFGRTKRTVFRADYTDKNNYTEYTLDGHNLTKVEVVDGKANGEKKQMVFGQENGEIMRMNVELSADSFVIKNREGKVIDSIRKSNIGRFAFVDDVMLNITQ